MMSNNSNFKRIWCFIFVRVTCPCPIVKMFDFGGQFYTNALMFQFPCWFSLVEKMLFAMVKKTMDQHVLPNLASIVIIFISFDLWMSHDVMDIFSLVIKFLNDTQVPMHITMGLFKVNETTKQSIVIQFYSLLKRDWVCCIR